ncbi:MAG: hypothetical protein WA085_07825, partial [Sphingobium sp.]
CRKANSGHGTDGPALLKGATTHHAVISGRFLSADSGFSERRNYIIETGNIITARLTAPEGVSDDRRHRQGNQKS